MSLRSLPAESILDIADELSSSDLNALGQSCRSYYTVLNGYLYRNDARKNGMSALFWACVKDKEDTARLALSNGADAQCLYPDTMRCESSNGDQALSNHAS